MYYLISNNFLLLLALFYFHSFIYHLLIHFVGLVSLSKQIIILFAFPLKLIKCWQRVAASGFKDWTHFAYCHFFVICIKCGRLSAVCVARQHLFKQEEVHKASNKILTSYQMWRGRKNITDCTLRINTLAEIKIK